MHSVTDRRTDGQQDDANSRSYCAAVRSAKNSYYIIWVHRQNTLSAQPGYSVIVEWAIAYVATEVPAP